MHFLKQSYISFANPKLHEARQFSNILSKSLDPTAEVGICNLSLHFCNLAGIQIDCRCVDKKSLRYAVADLQN
jgi:hypothetical protein